MAAQNSVRTFSHLSGLRPAHLAWIPALMGIAVICGESTNVMGAGHTGVWLTELAAAMGHPNGPVGVLNHLLRKSGHFAGFGILGLCFARGWRSWLRRRISVSWSGLRMRAGALGIASVFVVASADEIHQIFLPTRGASVWDVLLDTSGAVTLNVLVFGFVAMRRNALLNPSAQFTTLGLSLAGIPTRMSHTHDGMRRAVSRSVRLSDFGRAGGSVVSRTISRDAHAFLRALATARQNISMTVAPVVSSATSHMEPVRSTIKL